jgi:hypothetical protein
MTEILVGAPGDDESGQDTGAVYIFFPRRRRFHRRPFDLLTFCLIITIPSCFFCSSLIFGIWYFFHYFRRRPDPVEPIVMESDIEIGKAVVVKKYKRDDGEKYIDYYIE